MSLYFMDDQGNQQDSQVRGRVPRDERWNHYRHAWRDRRHLVEAVYKLISEAMRKHAIEKVANSSEFGATP